MQKVRLCLMLLALIVVSLTPMPSTQAGDNWYAYLFNGMTNELIRVNFLDGSTESFNLDLPPDVYLGGYGMAFNADASVVAYCLSQYTEGSPRADSTLIVRDLAGQANLLELPLGGRMGCRADVLTPDAGLLALNLVNYFPGDPQNPPSEGEPIWQLLILDTATGSTVYELNSDSPAVAAAGMLLDTALILDVRDLGTDSVIFIEVPYGIGGAFATPAYRWQLDAGTVDPVERWGEFGFTKLATTGEQVWLAVDPNLPASEGVGEIGRFNVLMLVDDTGAERMIYHCGESALGMPVFINGGMQLAVELYPPFDPEATPDQKPNTWIALNRDGSVIELESGYNNMMIVDAPGGYAAFRLVFDDNWTESTFTLEHHVGDQATVMWESPDQGWEMVWTSPAPPNAGMLPFPTWTP